jgi:hypothetical protein
MLESWADSDIWTVADIKRIIGDVPDMIENSNDSVHLNAVIQDSIDVVKRNIARKLRIELPGKYVNYPGINWSDEESAVVISFRTTDTMLDKLSNPSELFDAGVYLTIAQLYRRAATHARFDDGDANKELVKKAEYWEGLGNVALTDSMLLLTFDFDESYTVEDSERAQLKPPTFLRR